jgi:hypothetical protein
METLAGRVLQSWNELRIDDCRRVIDQVHARMESMVAKDGYHFDMRL